VWGSRGAAAMTAYTCTPFARCRIFRGTGFHLTSADGWHATSSCNTWSSTRRTIASSCDSGLKPPVLTARTATGVSARPPARFPRVVVVATGYTRLPHLPRWPGAFDGPVVHSVEYRNPQPYRGQDVLIVGAGNSGTEIAVDLAEGGAARVRIAVRTAPNILRRDVKGFPTQLLGIVFRRLPPRLLDRLIHVLERTTTPELSDYGLPRPSAPFSQFRRTGTVPIFDVGFIDAVRSGVIEVVPGVTALDGRAVVLADSSRVFPDAVVAATGYHPGLGPLVGHLTAIGEHGIPSPQPRLHFIGMRIPISGFLHEVGMDARQIAGNVARELGAMRPHPTAIAK
jgi:putative flavoprotein involved in K+ transport